MSDAPRTITAPPAHVPLVALGWIALLGTLWGISFSLVKIGGEAGIPAVGWTFWMCAGSAVVLMAICVGRRDLPPADSRHVWYYVIGGLTGIGLPMVNAVTVVAHIPAGVMALVVQLSPIFTYGLGLAVGMERLVPQRAAGILLGLSGVLLLVLPRASLPDPVMHVWVALAVITPAFHAISNIYLGMKRPPGVSSLALAAGMQVASATTLLPAALLTGGFYVPNLPPTWADAALAGHTAVGCVAMLLFFEIMRLAGAVVASMVGFVVTLTGIAWGWVFFDESHTAWFWAALILVVAGLYLVTRPAGLPTRRAPG